MIPVPSVPYRDAVRLLALRCPAPVSTEQVARGYGLDPDEAQCAINDAERIRRQGRRR